MFRSWMAAAALVAASTLAGCTLLQDGDGRNGDLVRIVDLSFDPDAFEGDINDATDVLAAIADVRFEYTHDGDALDPDDVMVEYVEESGRERSVPLSDFTTADSVGRGDKVTIAGALLTSPIRIAAGENLLASRGGPARDWLEASGYPLPLAMRGGLAVWDVKGTLELDAGFDHIEVLEEGVESDYRCDYSDPMTQDCSQEEVPYTDDLRLSDAAATGDADLDAKLSLDSVGTAMNPALELGLEGTWIMAALFNVHVAQERTGLYPESMDADFGFELDLTAVGDGALRFRFDRDDQVEAIGGQGDLDVSGDVTFWDDEHPRSEGYSPGDLNDIDVHTPYEEQPSYGGGNPADFIVQALSDLWRMDLAPGDEFHLSSGDRFGSDLPSAAITVRVVDEGSKKVPAGTFTALRVETTSEVTVPIEGAAPEVFELPTLTTWIDSDSGVPVAIEQSLSYDYDQDDFAPIFAAAETWDEGLTLTPPDELHIDLGGRTVAELEEWKDGLHMAPMAAIVLPLAGFASPFASFMFMGFGMPMYGFDDDYEYEMAPDVAFSTDETRDRITIVTAQNELYYWDFQFKASQPVLFERNAAATSSGDLVEDDYRYMADELGDEFNAGDYFDFCSAGAATTSPTTVSVMHVNTNTLVYETTLMSLDACA